MINLAAKELFPLFCIMWAYGAIVKKIPTWLRVVMTAPVRLLFAYTLVVRDLYAYEIVLCCAFILFFSIEGWEETLAAGLALGGISFLMWFF